MKSKLLIICICVAVAACGIGVYASGLGDNIISKIKGDTIDITAEYKEQINQENMQRKDAINTALNNSENITNMQNNDASYQGEASQISANEISKFEQLIIAMNATIADPTEFNELLMDYEYLRVVHGLSQQQLDYIADLVIEGCDMKDIINIAYFWLDTDDDISVIKEMYDLKGEFEGKTEWLSNAYDIVTNAENGSLSVEDVEAYYAKGITADEIITADILCRKGVYTIQEILDKRCAGQSLVEIANEIENGGLLGAVTLAGDVDVIDYNDIEDPQIITEVEETSELTGRSNADLLNSAASGENIEDVLTEKKNEKYAEIRSQLSAMGLIKSETEVD